jgi:hypothetical protein
MIIHLIASGDSRPAANRNCWPAQQEMEAALGAAVRALGHELVRAHPYDANERHGFISSQRQGMDVLAALDPDVPLIIAESVWQYSHHVYPGLYTHRGPILTVANWSGTWPGLVGMLNLNGCLTKAGITYSTLWGEDFGAADFRSRLQTWIDTGRLAHPTPHVTRFSGTGVPADLRELGIRLADELVRRKAILGVFDEGCMGMFNAIIPDHLLHPLGVFKERLSQSALLAEMNAVDPAAAEAVYAWLVDRGFTFHFGSDPASELTRDQVLDQCRMYIAACRIGDHFGCDAIGIQYQQGLKDMCCASDLAEGLLNNGERPPVANDRGELIKEGVPFPHFNEVDECAGLDALLINRVHQALGQPPETTLHDLRWGDRDRGGSTDAYVWVFEISGAAPPAHHIGGYAGSSGERQPAMYFPRGGSTLKGVARPGEIVWSRIYVQPDGLYMDLGRASVVELTPAETERRRQATTPQWPIMHAVLHGVTRDQMMAKHQANHVQVVYADSAAAADRCLQARAVLAQRLGITVNLCGVCF